MLVRLAGTVDVELRTREDSARLRLDRSDVGLFVDAGVWTAQTYGDGAALLLIASEPWRPESYSDTPLV